MAEQDEICATEQDFLERTILLRRSYFSVRKQKCLAIARHSVSFSIQFQLNFNSI